MGDTIQGKEEMIAEVQQQAKDLEQRDLTTGERLDKFFNQPGARYGEEQTSSPQRAESKQPEPVPSSEQTKPEQAQQSEGEKPRDDYALPDGVSERTKEQFNKLLEENRRLKQEKKQYGSSVFDEFRKGQAAPQQPQVDPSLAQATGVVPQVPQIPQITLPYPGTTQPQANQFGGLSQQQVDTITQQFVASDGTVDIQGLNHALVTANQRALAAERQAQLAAIQARQARENIERFEEDQQVREAHAEVPEIDPSSKHFDQDLFELVRDRLLKNMWDGKKERLVDVAKAIKKFKVTTAPVNVEKAKEEAVTQYKQAQAARDQMPLESGVGQQRTMSFEDARKVTRRGGLDNPALDERMRRAGIIS